MLSFTVNNCTVNTFVSIIHFVNERHTHTQSQTKVFGQFKKRKNTKKVI